MFKTHQIVRQGVDYLEKEFPNFSYNEGILNIDSEKEVILTQNDSIISKVIIDTKVDNEEEINKYINQISESGNGVIILKDKVIVKNESLIGTINYNYNEMLSQIGITNFNKQDVINYANSIKIMSMYISIFLTIFIYGFIMYFVSTIFNVLLLSIFGYLTTLIAKIKMRYVAIFNMSIYALTLSIILNFIYIFVNLFIEFNMKYFQVMYVSVAAIYLVAAIFLLKLEFIKKQGELQKIVEAQEIIKQQLEEKKKENKDDENEKNEENKEVEKKESESGKKQKNKKKEDKENDTDVPEEPDGANA